MSTEKSMCCKKCLDVSYMTGDRACLDAYCSCHKPCTTVPAREEISEKEIAKSVNLLNPPSEKQEEKCTKCGSPFLGHHHRHYTRTGVFHSACYGVTIKGMKPIDDEPKQEAEKQCPKCRTWHEKDGKCLGCGVEKQEAEGWIEAFDRLAVEMGHRHNEDCEFVCNFKAKVRDFISTLLDRTRKEAYSQGVKDEARAMGEKAERWIEAFDRLAVEMGHRHNENCEFVCNFKGKVRDFITQTRKEAIEGERKRIREALIKRIEDLGRDAEDEKDLKEVVLSLLTPKRDERK